MSDVSVIACPACGFSRYVPVSQLPKNAVMVTCPKCKERFPFPGAGVVLTPPEEDDVAPVTGIRGDNPISPKEQQGEVTVAPPLNTQNLLSELAKTSRTYKRRAWIAMGGLMTFMTLYMFLAGWFLNTAYRLTLGANGSKDPVFGWIVGLCALLLAAFMLKGFFFIKRGGTDHTVEITAKQQPRFFQFLYTLADEASAPRPHRVFLSADVNAAVFYDLSIMNLFLPSRKNLEVGLGLVNALNVGEFRAVLAHEFGHFAQRAMAVGRWVYIAQQIAGNLVARRDKLDDFLAGISRIDLRIAWIGWLLSLVVWSIRSVVDSAFGLVVMMQRALSREMEFQADLVSVSLTGSDALIHALHRLQSADNSWDRAASFAFDEKENGRMVPDVFAVQSHIMARMADLLDDADYGKIPPLPAESPESHRLFKAALARPPKMWSTHPLNHEREENAKRRYVPAAIDAMSAWDIFDNPELLRKQVSVKLLQSSDDAETVPTEEILQRIDRQFDREHLKSCYRGVYSSRSPVRGMTSATELYKPVSNFSVSSLDDLYPHSLTQNVEQLKQLETELAQLSALQAGVMHTSGATINVRGKIFKRKELTQAIRLVENDLKAVSHKLQTHDNACRSMHLAAAARLGRGWEDYLKGLIAVMHYAEHSAANLRDAQGALSNTINAETATRKVSSAGVSRIVKSANELHTALKETFDKSGQVVLDDYLLRQLDIKSWQDGLGEFKLGSANKDNISEWLNVIDDWANHAAGACGALRLHALEQLLLTEATIAAHLKEGKEIGQAPRAPKAPATYTVLLPGKERPRVTRLGWWARFQTADGLFPSLARFVVAAGIIVTVLGFGASFGKTNVTIYNGLRRPVTVHISGSNVKVAPLAWVKHEVDANTTLKIETFTDKGVRIEAFDADVRGPFPNFVYNIAAAAPLVEWTCVYGNATAQPDRNLGAPRWTGSKADVLFEEPPASVSSEGGGAMREVLSALGDGSPSQQLDMLEDKAQQDNVIKMHARWDSQTSRDFVYWLELAKQQPVFADILKVRLQEAPDDVLLLRAEQDTADETTRSKVYARIRERANAQPENADLQYLAARGNPDQVQSDQAFLSGHQRWPENGWFALGAGYVQARSAHWQEALAAFEQSRHKLPAMADLVASQQLRIMRLLRQDTDDKVSELTRDEHHLQTLLALENTKPLKSPELKAYQELNQGHIDKALSLVKGTPAEPRLLRLSAASDGASPAVKARALALTLEQGIDPDSVWAAISLAIRSGRDYKRYMVAADHLEPKMAASMDRFIACIAAKKVAEAEHSLDGLPPELYGQACCIGVVVLGDQAPKVWRDRAKRLLFVSERPYLS